MVHMYICAVPILVMQMDPSKRGDNRDPRLLHGGPAGVLAAGPGDDMPFLLQISNCTYIYGTS
jgi:hypothetical protein